MERTEAGHTGDAIASHFDAPTVRLLAGESGDQQSSNYTEAELDYNHVSSDPFVIPELRAFGYREPFKGTALYGLSPAGTMSSTRAELLGVINACFAPFPINIVIQSANIQPVWQLSFVRKQR